MLRFVCIVNRDGGSSIIGQWHDIIIIMGLCSKGLSDIIAICKVKQAKMKMLELHVPLYKNK